MRIEPAGLAKSIGILTTLEFNQGSPRPSSRVVEAAKLLFEADGAGLMLVGKDELLTWASASDPQAERAEAVQRSKGARALHGRLAAAEPRWRCGTWRPYRLGRMTAALVTGADGTEPANPIRRSHRGLRLAAPAYRGRCCCREP